MKDNWRDTQHNRLNGLTADGHTQYALLAGRSGGQSLTGGTASGESLSVESTSNATKGGVVVAASDWIDVPEVTAPGTPGSGGRLYAKTTKKLYFKNTDGTEYDLTAAIASGSCVQCVNTQSGTGVSTSSTQIPVDNTTPQSSEGTQWTTLAITPTSTSNILIVEVNVPLASGTSASSAAIALFKDSETDARAVSVLDLNASAANTVSIRYQMTAGTTSAITFKVRYGPSSSLRTAHINRDISGGSLFNGVSAASITIWEIIP